MVPTTSETALVSVVSDLVAAVEPVVELVLGCSEAHLSGCVCVPCVPAVVVPVVPAVSTVAALTWVAWDFAELLAPIDEVAEAEACDDPKACVAPEA
jgi:hypothetical protein